MPNKLDPTGLYRVVLQDDGGYYVYNHEGVRVSPALSEEKAEDMRRKMQSHRRER